MSAGTVGHVDQRVLAVAAALGWPVEGAGQAESWIKPAEVVPVNGQLVLALHTSWGEPRPAIAHYNAGGEWYSGGMSLMCVVGWRPIPPLEIR